VTTALEESEDIYKICVKPSEAAMGEGHQGNISGPDDLEPLDPRFQDWVVQEQLVKDSEGSVQFVMKDGRVVESILTLKIDTMGHPRHDLWTDAPVHIETISCNMAVLLLEQFYAFMEHGCGSVDFLVSHNRVYLTGVSFRNTLPRYAIDVLHRLFGSVMPFEVSTFAVPRNMPGEALTQHFDQILFAKGQNFGFIPFCFLPQHGVCHGLTFAENSTLLDILGARVEALQASLMP